MEMLDTQASIQFSNWNEPGTESDGPRLGATPGGVRLMQGLWDLFARASRTSPIIASGSVTKWLSCCRDPCVEDPVVPEQHVSRRLYILHLQIVLISKQNMATRTWHQRQDLKILLGSFGRDLSCKKKVPAHLHNGVSRSSSTNCYPADSLSPQP